jgi:hypothetical protein
MHSTSDAGLARFLDDGRVEMDTNTVERAIRPLVLNRKNALFAGHDEGAPYCPSGYLPTKAAYETPGAGSTAHRHRDARLPGRDPHCE